MCHVRQQHERSVISTHALRTEGDADNLDAAKDALPKFLRTPSTRRVTEIYLVKYTTTGKRNFPFHEVATAVS